MKIIGQNIPPELQQMYKRLIKTNQPDESGTARAQTSVNVAKKSIIKYKHKNSLESIAKAAYDQALKIGAVRQNRQFVSEELERLKNGIFSPDYWQPCELISTAYLESQPTSTEDLDPPPYAFRDPLKRPSIPTYPAGTPSQAPTSTTGQITGEIWRDGLWVWKKTVLSVFNPEDENYQLPIILHSVGQIEVQTEQHPSRPMFSIVFKAWLSDKDNSISDTTEPPTPPNTSVYYRFQPPPSADLPYSATEDINTIQMLNTERSTITQGDIQKVTLLTAPRPMMGHDYNNNSTVSTMYTAEQTVYQLKTSTLSKGYNPINTPADLINTAVRGMSGDGKTITGWATNGSLNISWLHHEKSGFKLIEKPAGVTAMTATAVNATGSVIAGSLVQNGQSKPFIYHIYSGLKIINGTAAGTFTPYIKLSADGKTLAGTESHNATSKAFIWTEEDGITYLDTSSEFTRTNARDISADGKTVIGNATKDYNERPYIWTAASGFQIIDPLNVFEYLEAQRISGNGKVITGQTFIDDIYKIWRWDEVSGVQILPGQDVNTEYSPQAINYDGSKIVGWTDDYNQQIPLTWQQGEGITYPQQPPNGEAFDFSATGYSGKKAAGIMAIDGQEKPFIYCY